MRKPSKLAPLWREEDWWAVWFGFIIILAAIVGVVHRVPMVGKWSDNPLSVLTVKRDTVTKFRYGDLDNPGALIVRLQGKDTRLLSGYLREQFSPEERDLLDQYVPGSKPSGKLVKTVVNRLNSVVRRGPLYSSEIFLGISLTPKTREQAKLDLSGSKLIKLNRTLLEEAYPVEIGVAKWQLGVPLVWLWLGLGMLTIIGVAAMGLDYRRYLLGFSLVYVFSIISIAISHQSQIKAYGLSYALWALLIGLLISNTIGTPKWLLAGAKTEMYIKTGLVLLGAEIIFGKILTLGGPGLFVAWLVTPTVILFMFWFGTRVLKMTSKSLVIIVAAATSVCGVSAAIATAAAARAKKEELTLAVGMTLIFTVLMMVLMPLFIRFIGMDPVVGGAWMGGTIDATGAVVAAGAMLGVEAEQVAAVVKMIQNVLIGVVAFGVAVYWVTKVERSTDAPRPSAMEIWYRLPKFIVGFVAASVIFSFILIPLMGSTAVEVDIIKDVTKNVRGWLFCMAFVSIGLESNFRDFASQLVGGKPIWLYIVGQSTNLILTLIAAWLAFGGILFDKVF